MPPTPCRWVLGHWWPNITDTRVQELRVLAVAQKEVPIPPWVMGARVRMLPPGEGGWTEAAGGAGVGTGAGMVGLVPPEDDRLLRVVRERLWPLAELEAQLAEEEEQRRQQQQQQQGLQGR